MCVIADEARKGRGRCAVVRVGCSQLGVPDVDGSIVRAHQHGAAADALGNPVRLLLMARQASEYTHAEALIDGFHAGFVLADKGYDFGAFVEEIQNSGVRQ